MAREKVIPINASVDVQESAEETVDTEPEKRQRERIGLLERRPSEDCFIRRTIGRRRVWFVRVESTGMHPRLYGPFATRRTCMLFLDDMAGIFCDAFWEGSDKAQGRNIDIPFAKTWGAMIIEDPVVKPQAKRKGR